MSDPRRSCWIGSGDWRSADCTPPLTLMGGGALSASPAEGAMANYRPFIDDPAHLARLSGERYIGLRPSCGVLRAYETVQRALRKHFAGLPISYPAHAHITLKAAWIPILLLGATAGWMLLHDPATRDRSALSREIAGRSSPSGSMTSLTAGAGVPARSAGHDFRTVLAAPTSPPASDDRYPLPVEVRSGMMAGPGGPARSIFLHTESSPYPRRPKGG